jgi:hypothetical protein
MAQIEAGSYTTKVSQVPVYDFEPPETTTWAYINDILIYCDGSRL